MGKRYNNKKERALNKSFQSWSAYVKFFLWSKKQWSSYAAKTEEKIIYLQDKGTKGQYKMKQKVINFRMWKEQKYCRESFSIHEKYPHVQWNFAHE